MSDFAGTIASAYDIPNLQLAVDAYLEVADRTHTLVGFGGPVHHMELSLSALVHDYGFGRGASTRPWSSRCPIPKLGLGSWSSSAAGWT